MTVGWTPVFVLPNIPLQAATGCDIAALAPAHDPRVTAIKRAQPMFRCFLNRFSDNFGQKFEPSVLLVRATAPPAFFDISALASFRDLIAIATTTYGRRSSCAIRAGIALCSARLSRSIHGCSIATTSM